MSTFIFPEVPVDTTTTPPDFALAMRGYDRLQVDDYVTRQAQWLAEARGRVEAAEATARKAESELAELRTRAGRAEKRELSSTPRSIEALGERVGRILQVAVESGEEVKAEAAREASEARAEGERVLHRARAEAATLSGRVEQEARAAAERTVSEARADADRRMVEAQRREQEVEVRIAGLAERRRTSLAELSRVHAALAAALDEPESEADPRPARGDDTVEVTGVIDLRAPENQVVSPAS